MSRFSAALFFSESFRETPLDLELGLVLASRFFLDRESDLGNGQVIRFDDSSYDSTYPTEKTQ